MVFEIGEIVSEVRLVRQKHTFALHIYTSLFSFFISINES